MCALEFPGIENDVWQRHKDSGTVQVLAVNADTMGNDTVATVQQFVDQTQITFPAGIELSDSYAPLRAAVESISPYPLDIVIDKSEQKIRLELKGLFFKEYSVVRFALPPQVKTPVKTEIKDRVAWFGANRVLFNNKNYLKSKKWLQTTRRGLIIRAFDGSSGQQEDFGILVAPEDMEEMFTLIRVSTPVRFVE